MTTIAYKDGILAGDTGAAVNHVKVGNAIKVFNLNHVLVGVAGTIAEAHDFIAWIENGKKSIEEPKYDGKGGDFNVICINKDRVEVILYEGNIYPLIIDAPFHALGSGFELATGAMAAGASAIEAVEIAIKYDCYTFGEVTHVSFGD